MGRLTASDAIARAPEGLRPALAWFHGNAGSTIAWPEPAPVPGVARLACKPKGIYKPAGFDVALSVRQALEGPYDDKRIVVQPDDSWTYEYFQEGASPSERDAEYTNKALMENIRTSSPVGVLLQVRKKPQPRYLVRGLAVVVEWRAGFFILRGFTADGVVET